MLNPIKDGALDLESVADEAAGRLAIAFQLLRHHEDPDDHNPDPGGWDLTVVEEIIKDVVEALRRAVKRLESEA